jgi:hypothetical protein
LKPKSARLAGERIHKQVLAIHLLCKQAATINSQAKLWFTFVAVQDLVIVAEPERHNRKPRRFLRCGFRSQTIPEVERSYLKETFRPMRAEAEPAKLNRAASNKCLIAGYCY